MNDNIASTATGSSSPVLLSSPNADQTNSLRSTRSLANLLAACVGDPDVTAALFALTTPFGGPQPGDTAQALANLARDPARSVAAIHALTLLSDAYAPSVADVPDAWTVTVKVNDSGSDDPELLFGGPGNLAFDDRGYAWVTNNVVQGKTTSTRSAIVLKPNGQPISPATGYPVPSAGSEVPIHNGDPLYGADRPPSFVPMMRQTGVVIDQAGNIWSINNWKPDFDVDAAANPGGDGIITFSDLPRRRRGTEHSRHHEAAVAFQQYIRGACAIAGPFVCRTRPTRSPAAASRNGFRHHDDVLRRVTDAKSSIVGAAHVIRRRPARIGAGPSQTIVARRESWPRQARMRSS